MSRGIALLARLRRDESGTTIVEVLASAVVLAMVSIGVLSGIDSSQNLSNKSRLRSVAASLAQADQERLRGLRAKELSNRNETTTRVVRGANFTIKSTSAWVSDGTGQAPCGGRADYMRVKSSVGWDGMDGLQPIEVTSLVAPPTGSFGSEGAIAASITDRAGVGVANQSVTITGPRNMTDTTDSQGCAFFGYISPGSYQLTFSKAGYVDASGRQDISETLTVAAEQTVPAAFLYDRPGSLTVNFQTKRGAAAPIASHGGFVPAATASVWAANSGVPSGARTFARGLSTPGDTTTSFTLPGLFPFTDPYSVYGGNCPGANPVSHQTPPPAAQQTFATVLPGGSSTTTVQMPSVRFRYPKFSPSNTNGGLQGGQYVVVPYRGNSSTSAPLTQIKLTAESLGCGGVTTWVMDTSTPHTVTDDANANQGFLDRPLGRDINENWGVPVGQYDVCVDLEDYDPPGWPGTNDYRAFATDQLIRNPNGSTVSVGVLGVGNCP